MPKVRQSGAERCQEVQDVRQEVEVMDSNAGGGKPFGPDSLGPKTGKQRPQKAQALPFVPKKRKVRKGRKG